MAETFIGQPVNVADVVVYLKNLRTGSSTIRKCKCIGVVKKTKGKNVDIVCLKTEKTYFDEVGEVHKVVGDEIICILDEIAMFEKEVQDGN